MYTPNKEPLTWSYSLSCTHEKLRPQVQGDMVTTNTGGMRYNFSESHFFLSLASHRVSPPFLILQSYVTILCPFNQDFLVSPPLPLQCVTVIFATQNLCTLFWKWHQSHLPPSPFMCFWGSQTWPWIPEMDSWFKAHPRGHISLATVLGSRMGRWSRQSQ